MYMKAIQVLFDEKLLRELGRDAEVKRDGRSAVLRRAAAEYLRKKRRTGIRAAYERAYGKSADKRPDDFAGWSEEASWPEG
jgi:metal-responsive CopG/Arc/MetJ family transcriptional regulator